MKHKIIILTIFISTLLGLTGCMGVSHLAHSKMSDSERTIGTNETIEQNQNNQTSVKVTSIVYACPMHPEVVSDKPGKCQKCGMDLVVQNSSANSHDHSKMGCMNMMMPNNNKSHIGMYLGGGAVMVGMMTLMVLRFL